MGLGKILLGAAVGVGAVAAAPFTGGGSILAGVSAIGSLAGAGTIAAAAGAAAVGAAAGSVASDAEKEKVNAAKTKGRKEGMIAAKKEYDKKLAPYYEMEKRLLNLYALGMCVAACDGNIDEREELELREYLEGEKGNLRNICIEEGDLLSETEKKILSVRQQVLNKELVFKDMAKSLIKNAKSEETKIETIKTIDAVVEIVVEADDVVDPAEEALVESWKLIKEILA